MPTIPDKCEFDVAADQIEFRTKTNGDYIHIEGMKLGQGAAAILAWLVNTDNHLTIEIKLKEE